MAPINDAYLWGRKAAREGMPSYGNPYRNSLARSEWARGYATERHQEDWLRMRGWSQPH